MTRPVSVREATPATAGHVVQIVNAAYHRVPGLANGNETRADVLERLRAGTVLLFSHAGKDCGTLSYAPDPDRPDVAEVRRWAVHPGAQRRGIGASMGELIVKRLKAEGYTAAEGFSLEVMPAMHRIHAAHGADVTSLPALKGRLVRIPL